ncbi:MAG: NAD(P)H-dependent oxidoreductase [Pseudomonadota bacterium]
MPAHHLLGISGSLRAASTNTKLVHAARDVFDPAEFTMGSIAFPLYSGDVEEEEGIPAPVQTLADQIAGADAVIISTPEYNKLLSGALKNALDWLSRTDGNPWKDKPVAIMSAAAGRAGGERGQWTLRLALNPFSPRVIPGPEFHLAQSSNGFEEDGSLKGEMAQKTMATLMDNLRAVIG